MGKPADSIETRMAQLIEELAASREETRVSRAETTTSREETTLSRAETALSRAETSSSREETAAAMLQVAHLELALKSARTIGMAMGILMARRKLTEGAAFEALAEASQHENRKVRDIADDVVLTGDLPADSARSRTRS